MPLKDDLKTHVLRVSAERLKELMSAASYHKEGSMKQIRATALLREHAGGADNECDAGLMVQNDPDCLLEWCLSAMLGYMCITEDSKVTFSEMNRLRFKPQRDRYDLVEACAVGQNMVPEGPDRVALGALKDKTTVKFMDSASKLQLSLTCKALHPLAHQQLLAEDEALVQLCERLPRSEIHKFYKFPEATWRRKHIGRTLAFQSGGVRGTHGQQQRETMQYDRMMDRVKMRKLSIVFSSPVAAVQRMCSFVEARPTFSALLWPRNSELREFTWASHSWPKTVKRHSHSFQIMRSGVLPRVVGRPVLQKPEYAEHLKVLRAAVAEQQHLAIAFVRNEKKQKAMPKLTGREPVKLPKSEKISRSASKAAKQARKAAAEAAAAAATAVEVAAAVKTVQMEGDSSSSDAAVAKSAVAVPGHAVPPVVGVAAAEQCIAFGSSSDTAKRVTQSKSVITNKEKNQQAKQAVQQRLQQMHTAAQRSVQSTSRSLRVQSISSSSSGSASGFVSDGGSSSARVLYSSGKRERSVSVSDDSSGGHAKRTHIRWNTESDDEMQD
jgi:hypothetical protein